MDWVHQLIWWFFLNLLLFQLIFNNNLKVEAIGNRRETEIDGKLFDRIIQIEDKNHHQDTDIDLLKKNREEDKIIIDKLIARVAEIEESCPNSKKLGDGSLRRRKRPVRLLHPSVYRGKESNKTISEEYKIPQFLGPPTSCYELGKFGYTLTGYYLVNDKEKTNTNTKIEMVFCQFYRVEGITKDYKETRIGFVNILDSPKNTKSPFGTSVDSTNNGTDTKPGSALENIKFPQLSTVDKSGCDHQVFQLKSAERDECLAVDMRKDETYNFEGRKCDSNNNQQLFLQKGKHICHLYWKKCMTMPNPENNNTSPILMPYLEMQKAQHFNITHPPSPSYQRIKTDGPLVGNKTGCLTMFASQFSVIPCYTFNSKEQKWSFLSVTTTSLPLCNN